MYKSFSEKGKKTIHGEIERSLSFCCMFCYIIVYIFEYFMFVEKNLDYLKKLVIHKIFLYVTKVSLLMKYKQISVNVNRHRKKCRDVARNPFFSKKKTRIKISPSLYNFFFTVSSINWQWNGSKNSYQIYFTAIHVLCCCYWINIIFCTSIEMLNSKLLPWVLLDL